MKKIISFCSLLLIFNEVVSITESEHDSLKKSNINLNKYIESNSKHSNNSNNDNFIEISTNIPHMPHRAISVPNNVLHLKAPPGYNVIPRKTLKVLKNIKSADILRKSEKILNTTNVAKNIVLPQNENKPIYKPFVFQSNVNNMSNDTHDSKNSDMNTTTLGRNNSIAANNEIKATRIVGNTTEPESTEENIGRSTVNFIVTENNQHKENQKKHHKGQRHHNKEDNKTIETPTENNEHSIKGAASIDTNIYKNTLEEDKVKEELEKPNIINLHLKLSHVDACNEIDCKPIEIKTTSPTKNNYKTVVKDGLSADTIELDDSSTKFEDSELLKYLKNRNIRNDGINQDMDENHNFSTNQSQIGDIIYSELRPEFKKDTTNNRIWNYCQQQPYNYNQCQHLIDMPVKFNKPLILPCLQKISRNNEPYFECNIPSYYDRELKHISSNRDKLKTNAQEINFKEPYNYPDNEIIEQVNYFNRKLNKDVPEKYISDHHFDECKDGLEYLKVIANWNDALKDIKRIKNDEYDNWYIYINQTPIKLIVTALIQNKIIYPNRYCLKTPFYLRYYLGTNLKDFTDSKKYDDEINYQASCHCS